MVIFLRFGSLRSDATTWLSPTEVFKRTGVKLATQYYIVKRWRDRNFLVCKQRRAGGKQMLSREQIDWLVNI